MPKRCVRSLLLLLLLSAAVSGCCSPALVGSLPVTLHPQETGVWCWAASGQMVMDYLGHNVAQCEEANKRFGRTDCCTTPRPGACVNTGWPEFDKFGFTFDRTSDAALTWSALRSQVSNEPNCSKKPFAFSWHWPGGGGHMMVVKGYLTLSGVNYVVVLDPLPVNVGTETIMTYDYFVTSAGHHTHWDDFYNVTYTGR